MITHSGVHIQKVGGMCGTPTIEDIAVHAGRICRFGGAVWYPLLPHLVFVGMLAYRRGGNAATVAWAFLHDAHEIATSDVPRPFKCDCMRYEQRAIDTRLFGHFLGNLNGLHHGDIDFNLIKQCDIDACHIEAVQLGVKNFAETEIKHADSYTGATEIYAKPEDVELFHGILRSPFYYADVVEGPSAYGVEHFIKLLTEIETGDIDAFWNRVRAWEPWLLTDFGYSPDLSIPKTLDFRGTEECRTALYELTKLMNKYDLPQVIVNRSKRMKINVFFHTQASYAAAIDETTAEFMRMVEENPDTWQRQPDGKYRPIDPLDIDILEKK